MFTSLKDLTARDGVLGTAACALVTHWIFKRYEPTAIPVLLTLLLLLPAIAAPILIQHYGIIQGVTSTFFVYYATLATSIFLYRISPFHPLARYPGPFLAKVSRWYWTFVALEGRSHVALQQLHDRYGTAVRIGPNEISFRDISVLQPLMGAQGMPKGPMWEGRVLKPPILPLIALRDNATHARRRKPWTRAFSSAALKNYEPVIAKRGAQLVELLAEKKQVDFVHWAHLFAFDFMSDALFGGGSDAMKDNDKDGIVRAVMSGFRQARLFENLPWIGYLARHLPYIGQGTKSFRVMCIRRGIERLEKGSSTKDLFYWLNNEDGSERSNPDKATVISDTVLAIIAGSDTTATVLSNIVYCLLAHPETYVRLQAEVDTFYPPDSDSLDPKSLGKMPYLEAVINETMRLYPVVPNGSTRAPERGSGGFAAGQYYIPEWTSVRVPKWAVQRNSEYFSQPDAFLPERWLVAEGLQAYTAPGGGGAALVHTPNAFIPFSFGPWNCVGKNLALLEMKMVLTHMVQRLAFRFADGFDPAGWERDIQDRFNLNLGPLPVVIERRV